MKKILPYILIVLILVNLFAPIGIEINNKNISVKNNIASAANSIVKDKDGVYTFNVKEFGTKATLEVSADFKNYNAGYNFADVTYSLTEIKTSSSGAKSYGQKYGISLADKTANSAKLYTGSLTIEGLTVSTPYEYEFRVTKRNNINISGTPGPSSTDDTIGTPIKINFVTSAKITQQGNTVSNGSGDVANPNSNTTKPQGALPECSITDGGSGFMGCVAQGIYYVLFQPTSYLFALTGTFFDNTFAYSVNDATYRSAFVVQGWGIVRDFCNMFFIFILLYIAFATILDLHGVKTKEMIISVVIIGIFINFSLFTTQIIIDASNIMARVFYNSDAIKITQEGGGTVESVGLVGADGVIPLSAALVNKVNPQSLIINSTKVSVVDDTKAEGAVQTEEGAVSASTFILVTILATIVNLVGLVVFMSVGLIFVARVIGLWLAMIVVPFVFLSYTVPSLQDMEMVGWKKWWPETLKMAFLAPVFIFFLYLIIKFLDAGLSITQTNADPNLTGLKFVVSIIIPFAFIMIFLIKAKDIAKDMSGKLGQSITGAVSAVGGLALGGAALGGAALLRNTVGTGLAAASRTEGAVKYGTEKIAFNKKLDEWKSKDPATRGAAPTWKEHAELAGVKRNPITFIGGKLNEKQMKIGEVDHARHEIEETKKAAGLEDVSNRNLSGVNEKKLKDTFLRTKQPEIETQVRKGFDAKGAPLTLKDTTGNEVIHEDKRTGAKSTISGEEDYKKKKRGEVEENYRISNGMSKTVALSDKDKKNIENQLNADFNLALKVTMSKEGEKRYEKTKDTSKVKVGGIERAYSKTNTGSWDVRNLSQISSHKNESIFTKIPTALISSVALGVRAGLKSSGVNHSTGQKDILKDISQTLKDSLAVMKIDLPKAPGGGGAPKAGGGGGHH